MTGVSAGGSLRLPLYLVNHSTSAGAGLVGSRTQHGKPIYVRSVWVREGKGAWHKQEIAWDRLDAGPKNGKPIDLIVDKLDSVGTHLVQVIIVIQSRHKWRSETFAFSTALNISVEANQDVVIQQNINYSADAAQSGATIYAPFRVSEKDLKGQSSKLTTSDCEQVLVHAGLFEREQNIRGMDDGLLIKRNATFFWRGFEALHTPEPGPINSPESLLIFGRDRTRRQPNREDGPENSNDVRLLVYGRDDQLDQTASMEISREHFCLFIANNRLRMRVTSENGASADGIKLEKGEVMTLKHNSCISPFQNQTRRLEIGIGFEVEHGEVIAVNVKRVPARNV